MFLIKKNGKEKKSSKKTAVMREKGMSKRKEARPIRDQ